MHVGQSAKDEAARNPKNTIYDVKRVIGLKPDNPDLTSELSKGIWPFKMEICGDGMMYVVTFKGQTQRYRPEEIGEKT